MPGKLQLSVTVQLWWLNSLPDAVELSFIKCRRLAVDPPAPICVRVYV